MAMRGLGAELTHLPGIYQGFLDYEGSLFVGAYIWIVVF